MLRAICLDSAYVIFYVEFACVYCPMCIFISVFCYYYTKHFRRSSCWRRKLGLSRSVELRSQALCLSASLPFSLSLLSLVLPTSLVSATGGFVSQKMSWFLNNAVGFCLFGFFFGGLDVDVGDCGSLLNYTLSYHIKSEFWDRNECFTLPMEHRIYIWKCHNGRRVHTITAFLFGLFGIGVFIC